MKHPHHILFIAAALWISPLLFPYLAMALDAMGVQGRSLDLLILPSVVVGGILDMMDAPGFLTSSTHGVSYMGGIGSLIVFGLPACVLVGWGLFLRARVKRQHRDT